MKEYKILCERTLTALEGQLNSFAAEGYTLEAGGLTALREDASVRPSLLAVISRAANGGTESGGDGV